MPRRVTPRPSAAWRSGRRLTWSMALRPRLTTGLPLVGKKVLRPLDGGSASEMPMGPTQKQAISTSRLPRSTGSRTRKWSARVESVIAAELGEFFRRITKLVTPEPFEAAIIRAACGQENSMNRLKRARMAGPACFLATILVSAPAFSQTDFSGEWVDRITEDSLRAVRRSPARRLSGDPAERRRPHEGRQPRRLGVEPAGVPVPAASRARTSGVHSAACGSRRKWTPSRGSSPRSTSNICDLWSASSTWTDARILPSTRRTAGRAFRPGNGTGRCWS